MKSRSSVPSPSASARTRSPGTSGHCQVQWTSQAPEPPFTNGIPQADLAFPLGLTQPGKPLNITLGMFGDATECTSASSLDQIAIVATHAK